MPPAHLALVLLGPVVGPVLESVSCLRGMLFRNQGLGAGRAHLFWAIFAQRAFQRTELLNVNNTK